MGTTVETEVLAVTVFPDRAKVTVGGKVNLEEGAHQLVVDGLPLALEPESVRVAGRGTAQVRLQSVDVSQAHYERTPAARVRELEERVEGVEDELRVLTDELAGLAAQAKYLEGLRLATDHYARGLARGRTTVEDQARLAGFLQEQDRQLRADVRVLEQKQRERSRLLDKLRRELKELQAARPAQRQRAMIDVEALTSGDFSLEVSYVIGNAGWQPLYDLRLLEGEDGPVLDLSYIAQVSQNTGQDWRGVALTVSTARPALSQRMPELKPWYVNVYTPPIAAPAPAQAARRLAAPVAAAAAAVVDVATAIVGEKATAPAVQAEEVVAAVSETGTAVTFGVTGRSDVPSDGSPHKTTVARFKLDPRLDYLTVPKHTGAVFRRVTVSNSGAAPLLAGPANLFVGDEFVGRTELEYAPVGDEIELLLGVEERITVERELSKREVDKALLRDKRQLRYGYTLELNSLLSEEAKVEVHDHIPVSRHEEIKIRLEKSVPQPTGHDDLNLMEWHLTLPAGSEQKISYEYLVEYPRSLHVLGLID